MQDGPRFLTESDLNTLSTTKQTQYGAVGQTEDGRFFRYVGFGGTSTINPGLLVIAGAAPANSTGLVITATSVAGGNVTANLQAGSTTLVVTNGVTSVTANQFGFVEIIVSGGGTYKLKLRGNTAAGNAGLITLNLAEPLPVGTTTLIPGTDTVNLRVNPYNGVAPSLTKSQPIGVTICPVVNTASVTNYGWVQTLGAAFVAATTATKGQAVTQDTGGTAGFFMSTAAATDYAVGVAYASAASSTASVHLNIK